MKRVIIYTDGACSPNPGPGGWGVVLIWGDSRKELTGGELETTNNRMELLAAIKALESLKRPCPVTLYTDSNYVLGITRNVRKWASYGWRKGPNSKHCVPNSDLWQRLILLDDLHQVDWQWVRGHNGNEGNERADYLAGLGLTQRKAKT